MKQIVFKTGKPVCIDVPQPQLKRRTILVDVKTSCISTGTELTGLMASGKGLIEKAKENPEKVKAALLRMKNEGVLSVLRKSKAKTENETISGYSAAGIVKSIGEEVTGFSEGMPVAIAGAGFANHAEQAVVPVNLAVPIPDGVSFDQASTCALGGIALQGIRRAKIALGDYVVVFGCGAIGLITVQMLRASGARVIGIDIDESRLGLVRKFGAEFAFNPLSDDIVQKVIHASDGYGADKVILTLATSSSEPVQQAFAMSRRKGRVVLVGVTGMELDRKEMYKKELDFVISTSYGPGRYDDRYEIDGIDYPYSYVRWTEQRNMKAYLQLIAENMVILDRIIDNSYPVEEAELAYESLKKKPRPLLVLLKYASGNSTESASAKSQTLTKWTTPEDRPLKVALIGTGAFVQGMHVPNLTSFNDKFTITSLCDIDAISARKAARLIGVNDIPIETDYRAVLESDADMVLIGTRHNSHAEIAIKALKMGKGVFVEKPMCITREEFSELKKTIIESDSPYMVGYNRRFAPAIKKIRSITDKRINPMMVRYTMNGGYVPYDSWVQTEEGGGRIIGEACHIFDLFRSMTCSEAVSVSIDGITPKTDSIHSSDNVVVSIKYNDGSVCSLIYTSLGSKEAFKERMEVFCDEQLLILEDYQLLRSHGVKCNWASKRPEKGHLEELQFFYTEILKGNRFPIPLDELEETWLISRQVADQLTV